MDERRRTFMRDLERALLEAISESAEVHRTLHQHASGGLYAAAVPRLPAGRERPIRAAALELRESGARTPEPAFRINSDDLTLLRALGIDPTRKSRARK